MLEDHPRIRVFVLSVPVMLVVSAVIVFGFDGFGELSLGAGVVATLGLAVGSAVAYSFKRWMFDRVDEAAERRRARHAERSSEDA